MPTLWIKFPDEAMFYRRFRAEEKATLESAFSWEEGSPWRRALDLLTLPMCAGPLIRWHEDIPYFNGSLFVEIVSGGAIEAVPTGGGTGYEFCVSRRLPQLWAMLKGQWKLARFMGRHDLPDDKLAESLALGLCLQSLMLQLGSAAVHLAPWLARPENVPSRYKSIVKRIQAVQLRRTALSEAWREVFPHWRQADDAPAGLPEHFWDVPPDVSSSAAVSAPGHDWRGTPASGGQVVGLAVTDASAAPQDGTPVIFIFRQARPETVEHFGQAAGLVFCEGGVLSHACTVARERNIPAVTALGTSFLDYIKSFDHAWLSIDGDTGAVMVIESQGRHVTHRPTYEG